MVMLFVTLIFGYCIADICKPLQKLYCKIDWHCHMKDCIHEDFDGASEHCKCKWCGYKGMVDSQRNLFLKFDNKILVSRFITKTI